jgi:hypothetical protein
VKDIEDLAAVKELIRANDTYGVLAVLQAMDAPARTALSGMFQPAD